jgi:FAD/FMN-containing dehydrogenase
VPPAFVDDLRAAFDATTVLTGKDIDARYHTDISGVPVAPPLAVVRPRSTEDVSKLLKLCHQARVAVTTQGGMTGLVGATMPMPGEIVLSTERMNAIEEVDTGGGVVITQTGVPLQRLQERVGQDGFMFPLDLGARGSCTIGGNISTNAGGNRVIRYGMTRDLVLGLEAVLADGTILRGLRKYIKNNTGIDLKQLFVGTEGTLGVVTRAALRIFPAPAEQQVALCALPSFDKVRAFLSLARTRLAGDLTAFEVMWNEYYRLTTELVKGVAAPLPAHHPFYVLLEASGSDAERIRSDLEQMLEKALEQEIILDATIASSGAAAAAIWKIRDSSVELSRAQGPGGVGFDISLRQGCLCDRVRSCRRRKFARQRQIHADTGPERGDHQARLRHHRRFCRLDLGRTRHRHSQAAVSEAQPHRRRDRHHAHAEVRAGSAWHSQSRADFYDLKTLPAPSSRSWRGEGWGEGLFPRKR